VSAGTGTVGARFAETSARLAELLDQAATLQRAVALLESRLAAVEAAQARAGWFATELSAPGGALWEIATTGTDIELVPVIAGVRLN